MSMRDILKLNVGGQHFVTMRSTLCAVAGSMLAKMFHPESKFSPPIELDGEILMDRNPTAFPYILDYLRDGCSLAVEPPKDIIPRLRADADYFGLVDLAQICYRLSLKLASPVEVAQKPSKPRYHYKEITRIDDADHYHQGDWKLIKILPAIYAGEVGRKREPARFIFERVV